MAQLTRTWWGQRFIAALESFTDPARLGRGRSYARNDRILSYNIDHGKVTAKVRGKINPYFGVYKEPIYRTSVQIGPISDAQWRKLVKQLAGKASFVSQLLMNTMPEGIDEAAADSGLHLLPHGNKDFVTDCSCPDYWNPCKHIAGLCYRLAAELDEDPFLLFELRGLSREKLKQELEKTPLGKALAAALEDRELPPRPVKSYYTRPTRASEKKLGYDDYWHGGKRLPKMLEPLPPPGLPAVQIKKAGDYPAFWRKDQSFIEIMTEFYERVRKHNREVL